MARFRLVVRLFAFAAFLVSTGVSAQSPLPDYPKPGHWPYGPTNTAETWSDVDDSLLFYGEGTVLRIADVSDPSNMAVIGEARTNYVVNFIDILDNGQLAAVSDRDKWVTLIDIADPANPAILGRYEVEDGRRPYGMAFGPAGSNLLYVTVGPAGLWVLDITDPAAPTLAGNYVEPGTDFVFDVEVLGDYAFLADDVEGVTAIDVSNPAMPVFSSRFTDAGGASHITLNGNRAYVSRRGAGVHIIDLDVSGSPAVMTGLGVIETTAAPQGFGIFYRAEIAANGRAVIADGTNGNGLLVFDVDTPAAPVFLDNFSQSMFYTAVLGNTAFAARPIGIGVPQVRAIDVDLDANMQAPEQVDEILTFDESFNINIDGNLLLVANEGAGVAVIDVTDAANPTTYAWVSTGTSSAKSAAKVNDTLVVATYGSSLLVYDISDPQNPVQRSSWPLGGGSSGYEVVRVPGTDRVLVAANFGGVRIIDFTDPDNPTEYASWTPDSGNVTQVAIDGNIVAAGGGSSFRVLDFTVPGTPVEIDSATLPSTVLDIDIVGDLVYVANSTNGLRIWDYVSGGVLSEVGSYSSAPTSANGVKVMGDTAYIAADTFWGMLLVDVSNPASPQFIDVVPTPGTATKVDANALFLVLSDGEAGVRLWGPVVNPVDLIHTSGFEAGEGVPE